MKKLPVKFCEMIERLAEEEPRVDGLIESLSQDDPVTAVRVNPRKIHPDVIDTDDATPVPWCPSGVYLLDRPRFTLDPALHQGRYYVQDPSSMFIGHIIKELTCNLDEPLLYLDACAAPGGKTTTAIDSLPDGSLVVANEYDYRRAEILSENITKWGYPAVVVSRGDTARFRKLASTFDIIAADVPCSGEGMMRKDDDAVAQWSPDLVRQCAERQREIMDNLWGALKPGGYFIYSTCTFNRQENEQMVEYLVDSYGAESVAIHGVEEFPEITGSIGNSAIHAARFLPHLTRGEGLFVAVVRKPGEKVHAMYSRPAKSQKLPVKLPEFFPSELAPMLDGETLYAVPERWLDAVKLLCKLLDVIRPGVDVAVIKGKDLIPSQGVAMLAGQEIAATRVELTREQALDYLRRESISLPEITPRGFDLLTFQDTPLGWIKNLGNRANNLYPQQWRIRTL